MISSESHREARTQGSLTLQPGGQGPLLEMLVTLESWEHSHKWRGGATPRPLVEPHMGIKV